MGVIRLDMTISLDGYVTGPRDSMDDPMGIGGFRLFNWLDRRDDPGPAGQVFAEYIELSLERCLTTPDIEEPAQRVTHMRYRVRS